MKNAPSLFGYFFIAAVSGVSSLLGASDVTTEIKFSDPAKPGILKISLARGDLQVRGVETATTTVKSDTKPARSTPRKDGLRELGTTSGFSLTEKDNVITLDATGDGVRTISNLQVTVPRSTSLIISNSWGGDINCADVSGDLEIKNMNGRIKLEGVAGGVLVETMNGEILADVKELHDGKPLSFTSMNGEIAMRIPADAKANVRLRSQNGAILTDFDESALVTKTESFGRSRNSAPSSPKKPRSAGDPEIRTEIQTAVKEVVRASVDAAHEAAAAIREATDAAREALQESKEERFGRPPLPPRPSLPPMTGGKIVTGTLNEGGVEIQAATMNGDVTLRRWDGKK
ncbi:MAG: DUF4097 family beta strand repeat-containing protein [Opitutaceae bacterium]